MTTTLFYRKSINSKITSAFVVLALFIQLVAPLGYVYAVDEDPGVTTPVSEVTTEVLPEAVPADEAGDVLGEETSTVEQTDESAKTEEVQEIVVVPARVSATLIVCDTEADLPNWGATNQVIDANTASDFLAEHENCKAKPGWSFQWSTTEDNVGDNAASGGPEWTTFGPTDGTGVASIDIAAGTNVVVRQVPKHKFVDFSGFNQTEEYSAEMVCGAPEGNHLYNNRESLGAVESDTTYYCIGFNAPQPVVQQEPTVTLVATKIVCDVESDLPDLAGTNTPITATTATDFLAAHPNCRAQEGWNFQWSYKNVGSPGDNKQMGGEGWNLVGPTGANGTVSVSIPVSNDITVREERRAGYVNFSGIDNHHNSVSAEMVCTTPPEGQLHRYDNREPLGAVVEGGTYYCVAFNPITIDQQAPVCDANVNLIENGDFEAPVLGANSWSIIPPTNTSLKWLVSWIGSPATGTLGLEIQRNVAGSSFTGQQHAELDGDHPTTIWQTIPTVPGKEYKLDFQYSARPGVATADNKIDVKVDGVVLGAQLANDGSALGDTSWSAQSRTFVATGTTTKVEFADAGADTSYGGYLDAVSVRCQGDPVPPRQIDSTEIQNPIQKSMGTAGGFMAQSNTLGEVLGASTEAVDAALAQCGEYLRSYIKMGQKNQAGDVIRLQVFLNKYLGTKLVPRGVYDKATFDAVRAFQVKTADEVLEPWKNTPGGINENGTGYVYKTTKRMINMIMCPELNIEMPELE
jgi:hypothetical protein